MKDVLKGWNYTSIYKMTDANANVLKCPTCGSMEIKMISRFQKFDRLQFRVFSQEKYINIAFFILEEDPEPDKNLEHMKGMLG